MHPTNSKLCEVMNAHDAQRMAALFAPDYRSEQPVHPARQFGGHAQVADNWGEMFRGVPDLTVELLADTTDGATLWSEWVWRGHHSDGSVFEMRGITVMGLTDEGLIAEARLYMEPVEQIGAGIDDTVRQLAEPSS